MSNIPPPADDRVHSGTDDEQLIENDEKLEQQKADGELTDDERDRLDGHY